MRSEFRADIDCPWCLNAAVDHLRGLDGVGAVNASGIGHCVVVDHDDALSLDEVLAELRSHLHATTMSGNEITMADPAVTVGTTPCHHAPGTGTGRG
jgi:hypothetical protein